jgi:hypothetical protein
MKAILAAALFLIFVLIAGSAYARCVAVKLVTEMRDETGVRRETHMAPCPVPPENAAWVPQYAWEAMSSNVFWPARSGVHQMEDGASFPFILTGTKLPALAMTMKVEMKSPRPADDARCREVALRLSGKRLRDEGALPAPDEGADADAATRDIVASGDGEALLCQGDVVPRAAAIHLMRRATPALWRSSSPHEAVTSEVDLAWAMVP